MDFGSKYEHKYEYDDRSYAEQMNEYYEYDMLSDRELWGRFMGLGDNFLYDNDKINIGVDSRTFGQSEIYKQPIRPKQADNDRKAWFLSKTYVSGAAPPEHLKNNLRVLELT